MSAPTGAQQSAALTELLERRRARVISVLTTYAERRYAYHLGGASAKCLWPFGGPVSVMLALRDASGAIVTGELTVPLALWDESAFLAYLEALDIVQIIRTIGRKAFSAGVSP